MPNDQAPTVTINLSGAMPIGAEFLINTTTTGDQSQPTITSLASGGFVVSWTDDSGQGGDTSNYGIKAQIFDAAGNLPLRRRWQRWRSSGPSCKTQYSTDNRLSRLCNGVTQPTIKEGLTAQ